MRICQECGLRYTLADSNCSVDGSLLNDTEDTFLGEVIGSYRITRLLGQGGMGRVYLGVHPSIQSRVAIKVLTLQAACDPRTVERFFAEAHSVNRIRHDGIVKILDLCHMPDGRPYIIMEYLDGAPLSQWMSGQMLPLPQLRDFAQQILAALDAVHRAGIVHRDLKPDNIFISPQGRVKILDFGIAKLLPSYTDKPITSETGTGALLGTPHYMAPEQIEGSVIEPAADLYSVGAILYEAVTGRRVFQGDSLFSLFACVISDPPVPPQTFRPGLSASWQDVILRALEKSPSHRFASAWDMSEALMAAEMPQEYKLGHAKTEMPPGPMLGHAKTEIPSLNPEVVNPTLLDSARLADPTEVDPYRPNTGGSPPRVSAAQTAATAPKNKALPIALGAMAAVALVAIGVVVARDSSASDKSEPESQRLVVGDKALIGVQSPGYSQSAPDYSVKAFDAAAYLPKARKLALGIYPDAYLTGFDMPAVFPTGATDLSLGDLEVTYNFLSPKHSARTLPLGMEEDRPCWVYVEVNQQGVTARIVTSSDCKGAARPNPKCTVAQVWQKAIVLGAPSNNTVADMDYLWDGWFFTIDQLGFTESIPDDC